MARLARRDRRMGLVAGGGDLCPRARRKTPRRRRPAPPRRAEGESERHANEFRLCARRPRGRRNARISASMCGAAPWKPKIDCLSSPTAKIVRGARSGAVAGEEILGDRLHDGPLVGAGVLRLVDQDVLDARGRACRAPRRRPRRATGGCASWRSDRRNRATPAWRLAPVIGLQDGVADDEQRLGRGIGAGEPQAVRQGKHRSASAAKRSLEARPGRGRRRRRSAARRLRAFQPPASLSSSQEERRGGAPPPAAAPPHRRSAWSAASRLAVVAVLRGGKRLAKRASQPAAILAPPVRRVADLRGRSTLPSRRRRRPSRVRRSASASSMPPPLRDHVDPAADRLALCDDRIERRGDLLVRGMLGEIAHGMAEPRSRAPQRPRFIAAPRAVAISAAACVSSRTTNWPGTLASKGNWCSSRSQNAWIVWIFSPPGVSSALAKSRRACAHLAAGGRAALQLVRFLLRAGRPAASPTCRACRRRARPSRPPRPW